MAITTRFSLLVCHNGIELHPNYLYSNDRKGRNHVVENKKETSHRKKLSRKNSLDERLKRNLNKPLSSSLTGMEEREGSQPNS